MNIENMAIVPLARAQAVATINWRYEGDYAFYNLTKNEDTIQKLLNCAVLHATRVITEPCARTSPPPVSF